MGYIAKHAAYEKGNLKAAVEVLSAQQVSQKNLQKFIWALQTTNLIQVTSLHCVHECLRAYICVCVSLGAGPATCIMCLDTFSSVHVSCMAICDSMRTNHLASCSIPNEIRTSYTCLH